MNYRFASLVLLGVLCAVVPAFAANLDEQNYHRAFALINSGHIQDAEVFAIQGRDPILNKVIHSLNMAQTGNDIGFAEMANFISNNPQWPNLRNIEASAEQKIPAAWTLAEIITWFTAHPPVSIAGFYRYIDALNLSGRSEESVNFIRTRWVECNFTPDELTVFHTNFEPYLSADDSWNRLDRLLWKNDSVNARHMYPFVSSGYKALAEARLALASYSPKVDNLIDNVPAELKGEQGLVYEILRWRIHNNQDDAALAILRHPPDPLKNTEAWWDLRQTMARRLIEKKDYEGAYQLAANHGHLEGKHLAEAEFLCGWLALRFLDEKDAAQQHFQMLFDHAETPISHARGAYWLGRTFEAQGNNELAQHAYETASELNVAYYGQLAAARIYENATIRTNPDPVVPPDVRADFYNRDLIRAAEHLAEIGEYDRAHTFIYPMIEAATTRDDFALLTEFAYHMQRPDVVIEVGKAASKKNIMMTASGYPLLGRNIPSPPEAAFTHALIRQESQFNPTIRSAAGAEGLMQLMRPTASNVAKKLGIRFNPALLTETDYNLRLGTAFVQEQINSFDGSYVLALAGYNAGPHRVREWMEQIGDPRNPDVDVIDWVELIPAYETRNYVQRIMESLQIYRARLSGGEAPLQITKDLKR